MPQQSLDAVGPAVDIHGKDAANGTLNNGAAVVDARTGTIFFANRRSSVVPRAYWTYVVASTDLGVTWSKPTNKGQVPLHGGLLH